jgi:type II secretory pathway component PulF
MSALLSFVFLLVSLVAWAWLHGLVPKFYTTFKHLIRVSFIGRPKLAVSTNNHEKYLYAGGIFLLAVILGWMFAYETNPRGYTHRNRFTGAVCSFSENCW